MTDYATDWRATGACASADPELFFPIASGVLAASQLRKAQRICEGCGVRQQCLDFAMRNGEMNGVWGGTTPEERIRTRRALLRRRRADRTWQEARAS
jgi:WhiB family transcriptional regulator, redox-sensing transcriptional regulator